MLPLVEVNEHPIVDTRSETCRALVNVFENIHSTFENDPRSGIKMF